MIVLLHLTRVDDVMCFKRYHFCFWFKRKGLWITILWKTKVVLLFHCEFVLACQSLAPLLETKTKKKHSFKIIIGFFFTPPLFLATKVAISFVYCSPKTINALKSLKSKKSLQESTNRTSECHSLHRIYNSLLRMGAIHELKTEAFPM